MCTILIPFCRPSAAAENKAISGVLAISGVQLSERILTTKRQLSAGLARLLRRAQKQGSVRNDVGVAEVDALVLGCLQGSAASNLTARRRIVSVVIDGLRT